VQEQVWRRIDARHSGPADHDNDAAANRRLNKFSTLMGVLIGLNMSSVNRVRHTIARVKAALQTLVRLQAEPRSAPPSHWRVRAVPWRVPDRPQVSPRTATRTPGAEVAKVKLINIKSARSCSTSSLRCSCQLYQQASIDLTKVEPLHTMILEMPKR
jgi:hypothetical protein